MLWTLIVVYGISGWTSTDVRSLPAIPMKDKTACLAAVENFRNQNKEAAARGKMAFTCVSSDTGEVLTFRF